MDETKVTNNTKVVDDTKYLDNDQIFWLLPNILFVAKYLDRT